MNNIEAKKETYQDYVKQIYRFCMFKLNNKEDAEDITSEVFTKFFIQDVNKITNIRAWLYATTRNAIYDKTVRPSTENLTVANNNSVENNEQDININEPADVYNFESEIEREQLIKIIQEELKTLTSIEQDIIVMRVWDEMKFSEISKAVDEPEDNIKKKYYRAVEKIKINLQSSAPKFRASSFVLPAIFTSLLTIGKSTSLAAEAKFTSTILTNLLSSSFMIAETAAAAAATTAASSASGAATAGGISILGLTGTKLMLATTGAVTLMAGGVGTAVVVSNNTTKNQEVVQTENEIISEPEIDEKEEDSSIEETAQSQDCKNVRYVNSFYKNVSFEYNDCELIVMEAQEQPGLEELPLTTTVIKQVGNETHQAIMHIRPGVMGYGPANCFDTSYKVLSSTSNEYNPGRYLVRETNIYTYVTDIILPGNDNYDFYKNNTFLNQFGDNADLCSANVPKVFETNKKSDFYFSGYASAAIEFKVESDNTSNIELFDKLYMTINAGEKEGIWTYQNPGYEIKVANNFVMSDQSFTDSFSIDSDSSILFVPRDSEHLPNGQITERLGIVTDRNSSNMNIDQFLAAIETNWEINCQNIGIQTACDLRLSKENYKSGYRISGYRGQVAPEASTRFIFKSSSNKFVIINPHNESQNVLKMIESIVVK